jgi:hypothetical protein
MTSCRGGLGFWKSQTWGGAVLVKPEGKERLLGALKTLPAFVEAMEMSKSCLTCLHWSNGCNLARGQIPPDQVQKEGCPRWDWDGVVF